MLLKASAELVSHVKQRSSLNHPFGTKNGCVLPSVRESAFRNPADFCLWNWESWKALHVESGILAPVVQKLDSAIHRINCYPVDKYYEIQLLSTLCTTGPWALESGIQLMKSRIPRMIGIQLSSTDKESSIWNPVQNPKLPWIALHRALR